MGVIIIEDEKPAARLLQRKLGKLGIEAHTMLHSVEEALAWFSSHPQPDLIFLDIQLSDGLSFEIFEQIPLTSSVIFTTAYDEYALRAFKLNSIDYLLKPIDEDELAAAVEKFRKRTKAVPVSVDFDQIRQLLGAPLKSFRTRFTVRLGQQLKVIPVEEVECFYSENKGTYLHTAENRNYLLDQTLETVERELDPVAFFRISRKFIVPMRAIRDIQVHSNSRLKLMLPTYADDDVIVAREKVQAFRSWLES